MVTYDREDKGVLKDLASLLGNNSKKWDLLDLSKKNTWMISTLALLSEDMEAKTAVLKGPITVELLRASNTLATIAFSIACSAVACSALSGEAEGGGGEEELSTGVSGA